MLSCVDQHKLSVTAEMQQGAGHSTASYREGRRRHGFSALAEAAGDSAESTKSS